MKTLVPRALHRWFLPLILAGTAAAAPPVIDSFTADKTVIRPEGTVKLQWSITGAVSATLNPAPGAVAVPSGQFVDNPVETTTYTLRATNPEGSVNATVTVNIPDQVGVTAAAWSVKTAFANTATLGILDTLTKADEILGAPADDARLRQPSASAVNVPSIDYASPAGGIFAVNRNPPGGGTGDNFAVRATGILVVNVPGTYTFGINNADGGRLLIDLNRDGDFYLNPAVTVFNPAADIYDAGEAAITDNTLHTAATFTAPVTLTAGKYAVEYTFFDQAGAMSGELFYYLGGEPYLLEATVEDTQPATADLIISEFLTDNKNGLRDADGSREDWIEIYNGTAAAVNLQDYWLSDSAAQPDKWRFPAAVMASGTYRLVWASDKNTVPGNGEFHSNFKLSNNGEPLGLYKSNGAGGYTRVSGWDSYPPQYADHTYGFYGTDLKTGYFFTPTPGTINNGGYDGFTPEVKFSVDRGFHTTAQTLTLAFAPGVANPQDFQIRYTLNGSAPSVTNGLIYTAPLALDKTSVFRAVAVRPDWKTTDVDTHSFIFTEDVLTQTAAKATALGFPAAAVNGQVYRYPMTAAVVNANKEGVRQALLKAPTLSIVIDQRFFSNVTTGIYSTPSVRGKEVPCSLELLNEDGKGGGQFQINCGLRLRGGFSRDAANPKHALRFFFNDDYEGPLEYPLFQSEGASRFEKFDLRTSQNYSWAYQNDNKNTFLREEISRDLQGATGQPYSRCRYMHLYINGIYWGLYDTDERFDASFGEEYLGGDEDNYDVVKSAGNAASYNTEATGGFFDTIPPGSTPRPGDAAWSTTQSAWRVLWTKTRAARTTPANADTIFQEIQGLQPDGKTKLADGRPPLLDVDNLIDYMLVSFYCGSFDAPLSTFLNDASNNWFGFRNPETGRGFIFGVHDFEHGMGANRDWHSFDRTGPWSGTGTTVNIYNALPAADPLRIFRKQASWQTKYSSAGNFLKSNPAWLHEDLAFGSQEYRTRVWDRVHKHFYNGGALTDVSVLAKIEARRAQLDPIILAEQARWGNTSSLTKAAWNTEVTFLKNWIARGSVPNIPLTTAFATYGRGNTIVTLLRGYSDGTAKPLYSPIEAPVFSPPGGVVSAGSALTLSIPGANTPAGTIYYTLNGEDPRLPGGAINTAGGATAYTAPVTIAKTSVIKTRVWNGTTWSALMEGRWITGVPASSANLLITEINYNPPAGAPGTSADAGLYEFVELQNAGSGPIDLTGVKFSSGITYDFPTGYLLEGGARVVVVKDAAAFSSRYPDAFYPDLSQKTLSGAGGSLSNSGERLILTAWDGGVIRDFTFGESSPWPAAADGDGATLVLSNMAPLTLDPGLGANWSAHTQKLGNPGGPDLPAPPSTTFAAWAAQNGTSAVATADADVDGLPNLLEYLLKGNPAVPDSAIQPVAGLIPLTVGGIPGDYPTITFKARQDALDVSTVVETSSTLRENDWTAGTVLVSRVPDGNGMETFVYRASGPRAQTPRLFLRLRATLPP
ncbi:MAG: lamin tail domain-containing protein [Verrucomicrobiota bacterium]